ncbi:PREDICTED: uncharacterized protein LOC107065782 [Polistes dominula]|uniref:Uncharacterized protein LOC107065782 n=1 Tax=Polistes dominula TaxID=743375 RepID=A0ABM1I4W3_POLDO|nr:PREDICTED: uncharacterized protein LOC107065782 [Polistes dominula]
MNKKDDKLLEMEARIHAPLEWDSPIYCKIQDLHESLYDEACRLIKHHYFSDEPMCKAISLLKDKLSVNCYLKLIKTWMKDTTSLVALSANSGRVVGVAVTRINSDSEKTNIFSRNQIIEGKSLNLILQLLNEVTVQSNAYVQFGHDTYFRIYILCVHPTYHNKGIESALLRAFIQSARTMKLPAVGGVFTSGHNQSFADKIGFSILSEIRYSRWIVNEIVIFDDPGKGNYSVAFMGKILDYNDPSERHKDDV